MSQFRGGSYKGVGGDLSGYRRRRVKWTGLAAQAECADDGVVALDAFALQIIEELLTLPVAARIASRFVSLAQMQKSEKVAVSLSLSQSDIGLMVGSARPNVNRAIRELRELGLIETDYGRILVKNREGLVRYINDHGRQTKNNIDDE